MAMAVPDRTDCYRVKRRLNGEPILSPSGESAGQPDWAPRRGQAVACFSRQR